MIVALFVMTIPFGFAKAADIKNNLDSLVYITTGSGYAGGGILLKENYFLTNSHIIHGETGLKVTSHQYNEYPAHVVWDDEAYDLALVQVDDWQTYKSENVIRYAKPTTHYDILDNVYLFGHPNHSVFSATRGIISNRTFHLTNRNFVIVTDSGLYQGMSGGMMVNEKGQLLGMNELFMKTDGGSLGGVIPYEIIRKVMRDQELYHENRPAMGGVTFNATGKVIGFSENSTSHAQGYEIGDIVVSGIDVDGHEVVFANNTQRVMFFTSRDLDVPTIANIIRNGKKMAITLHPSFNIIPNDSPIPQE